MEHQGRTVPEECFASVPAQTETQRRPDRTAGIGSNYPYMSIYSLSTDVYKQYYMGSYGYQFYYTPGAYDPDIRWETTTTYNAGIDFGFLNDRITGNVDVYLRQTKDLLNSVITGLPSAPSSRSVS